MQKLTSSFFQSQVKDFSNAWRKIVGLYFFMYWSWIAPLTKIRPVDVSVVSDKIAKFTETGILMANGQSYDFDIVACCTGFDVAFAPHLLVSASPETY